MQKEGVDFYEIYAPVTRFETLRLVLLLAGIFDYNIKQYDFVTAIRNAPIDRALYMKQPTGWKIKCVLLLKSIYG